MKKARLITALLLAALFTVSTMSTAFAIYCIHCGTELPDVANFCFHCGQRVSTGVTASTEDAAAPLAEAPPASTLAITDVTNDGKGTVTVTWTDSADAGPYAVHCMMKRSESFEEDWAADKFIHTSKENLTETTHQLVELAPGVSYWLAVTDAEDNVAGYAYESSAAPHFPDFPIKLTLTLKYQRNSVYKEVLYYSASDIAKNKSTTSYGTTITMDYSQLIRERNYTALFTITDPNGLVISVAAAQMTLPRGWYSQRIPFFDLNNYLNTLLEGYGELPVGTHTISLYFDGMFVSATTFTVNY